VGEWRERDFFLSPTKTQKAALVKPTGVPRSNYIHFSSVMNTRGAALMGWLVRVGVGCGGTAAVIVAVWGRVERERKSTSIASLTLPFTITGKQNPLATNTHTLQNTQACALLLATAAAVAADSRGAAVQGGARRVRVALREEGYI
jgi:hypothetical protein